MTVKLVDTLSPGQRLQTGEFMGEIRVPVKLTNASDDDRAAEGALKKEDVRMITVDAVVDTGAVRSVIPQFVLNQLGVRVRGKEVAEYADGRQDVVGLTSSILFEILGRSTADEALILGDEVLIGQTVLEKLDLLADCTHRRLIPNPDHPDQPVSKVK